MVFVWTRRPRPTEFGVIFPSIDLYDVVWKMHHRHQLVKEIYKKVL